MTVKQMADSVGGELLGAGTGIVLEAVLDHRRLSGQGGVFAALKGTNTDGHGYVAAAAGRAAAAIVARDRLGEFADLVDSMDLVGVADVAVALSLLARANRVQFEGPVVAVTGSSGKTTTKNMLAACCAEALGAGCSTQGNQNNLLGVPLTLIRLNLQDCYLIAELGSNAFGEIGALTKLVEPTVAVVTCVGGAHLEGFGNLRGVLKEKSALPASLPEKGTIIIPSFDPLLIAESRNWAAKVLTFGYEPSDFVRILSEKEGDRASGTLVCRGETFEVELPTPGVVNIRNAATALAAAVTVGSPAAAAVQGLNRAKPEGMRMERRCLGGLVFLVDSYNANPDSMDAALKTLAALDGGRKVAVLGKMLELGDASADSHRRVGSAAADHGIDLLIAVGEKGRGYMAGAGDGAGIASRWAANHAEAAELVTAECQPGDVVLLKGSRGAAMELVYDAYAEMTCASGQGGE